MHRRLTGGVAALALLTATGTAAAAPGDLDPGFGSGGVATVSPGAGERVEIGWSVALTPDGGSVLAGNGRVGTDSALAVVRLRPDGSPDPAFGGDGAVLLRLGRDATKTTSADIAHVAVQPDGKVVVALGAADEAGATAATLVRLTAGGGLDPFFGTGGVVLEQLGTGAAGADSRYYGVAVQPDGRIVASGTADGPGNIQELVVRRFTAGGTPDGTYGTGGTLRAELSDPGASKKSTTGTRLALHPGGGVVVSGITGDDGDAVQGFVARVSAGGSLQPGFGDGGVRRLQFSTGPTADTTPVEPVVLPGGGVAVGGIASARGFVARLTPGGDLDTGWADAGRRMLGLGAASTIVYGLGAEPDGRLLVPIAFDEAGGATRGGLLRLTGGGDVDGSFAGDGLLDLQLSPAAVPMTYGLDVARQADGRYVVSGARDLGAGQLELLAMRVEGDPPPPAGAAGSGPPAPAAVPAPVAAPPVAAPPAAGSTGGVLRGLPARVGAVLDGTRLRRDSRGRALVRLRCPAGGAACRGVVSFRVAGKDAGRVAYVVRPGRTTTVRLPLGTAARRVLGERGSAVLSVRITRRGAPAIVRRVTVLARPR